MRILILKFTIIYIFYLRYVIYVLQLFYRRIKCLAPENSLEFNFYHQNKSEKGNNIYIIGLNYLVIEIVLGSIGFHTLIFEG